MVPMWRRMAVPTNSLPFWSESPLTQPWRERRMLFGAGQMKKIAGHPSVLAAILLSLVCPTVRAADYEGSAVVVDGDTIELHVADKVIPVRLCGIDSPEARHAGGPEASAKMTAIVSGKECSVSRLAAALLATVGPNLRTTSASSLSASSMASTSQRKWCAVVTRLTGRNSRPDTTAATPRNEVLHGLQWQN
jgi:hypothetical protein